MEDCRRQRSESSTGDDASHATHIAVSYIDKHYPQKESVSSKRNRNENYTWRASSLLVFRTRVRIEIVLSSLSIFLSVDIFFTFFMIMAL